MKEGDAVEYNIELLCQMHFILDTTKAFTIIPSRGFRLHKRTGVWRSTLRRRVVFLQYDDDDGDQGRRSVSFQPAGLADHDHPTIRSGVRNQVEDRGRRVVGGACCPRALVVFRIAPHRPARAVLGLTFLGQLPLHLVYGSETFLYGLHFVPLLVVLAALSTQTPARPVALLLAGALVVTATTNNVTQFTKATSYLHSNASTKSAIGRPGRGHP